MKSTAFIICDDVRSEQYNKLSLMGIFGDSIRIPSDTPFPAAINLGAFVRLEAAPNDELPDSFKFTVACAGALVLDGTQLMTVQKPVTREPARIIQLALSMKPLGIPQPGTLVFEVQLKKDGKSVYEPIRHSLSLVLDASLNPRLKPASDPPPSR